MNTAPETPHDDNEISLLDLFTVLIRYRKLVIGVTVFTLILAVAGYFAFPLFQYNRALNNREVQGRIFISIRPTVQQFFMDDSLGFILDRSDILMESLLKAGMDTFEYRRHTVSLTSATERARAIHLIELLFIRNVGLDGRPYRRNEEERLFRVITRNPSSAEVFFRNEDPEFVRSFLYALFAQTNVTATDFIRPYMENMVNSYERFMNDPHTTEAIRQILERGFDDYIFFRSILEGETSVLAMIGEPIITEPQILLEVFRSRYILRGVILIFAGIFMAVFLAFVLNAIRSIKSDNEAMNKIYDALGKNNSQ